MLGPEHEQKMEKAEKQRKNFKTRSSHTVNRQVVRAADHRRALEVSCCLASDVSAQFSYCAVYNSLNTRIYLGAVAQECRRLRPSV